MAASLGSRRVRYEILICALVIQIAISTLSSSLAVLLPFLKTQYGLTYAEAGFVSNVAFIGLAATLLGAGWAVDVLGERLVLIAGGLIAGLAAAAAGLAPSLVVLIGAYLALGIGVGTTTPAGTSALRFVFAKEQRAFAMGIRQMGIPIGGLVAAAVLPAIALAHGWRFSLVTAGAAALGVAAAVSLAYPRAGRIPRSHPQRATVRLTRTITMTGLSGNFLIAGQFCLTTYLVVFLMKDWHMSVSRAALLLALAQAGGALGRIGWGVVSDRLLRGSRRSALIAAAATSVLGCLCLSLLPTSLPLPYLVAILTLFSIGAIGWTGVQVTLLSELAPAGFEGRTVAVGMLLQQPAILLAPLAFGALVDLTQSFDIAWRILAVYIAFGILVLSAINESGAETDGTATATALDTVVSGRTS